MTYLAVVLALVSGTLAGWLLARARPAPAQTGAAVAELSAALRGALDAVEDSLDDAERGRIATQAALEREMALVRATSEQLRLETGALVTALRKPQTRGRWGEIQLRRVVELAGMVEHCDFEEQRSDAGAGGTVRPDLVVRLAGGRSVVVDAKVPLSAYLEAAEAPEGPRRDERLLAHARQLRAHVDALAAKRYWERFRPSPEFVVLFVPGDAFLAAALEQDPALLDDAARRKVVLATPMTLIALLRTVAYAWRQDAVARDAQQVLDLGRDIHERLRVFLGHVDRLGRQLGGAVAAFNDTVGSLESRVLVSARRLHEAGLADEPLPAPAPVERLARPPTPSDTRSDPTEASDVPLDAPGGVPDARAAAG